jgi:anti-sigma-K factor RskA
MTHDELRELTGAYALGVLSEAERRELEAHLTTCQTCAREAKDLLEVAGALAYAVPQHDPPAALRERVLKAAAASDQTSRVVEFKPRTRGALPVWLSAAASIAAVALGLYAMTLRQRIDVLEDRLRDANARADSVQRELAVAQASDTDARQRLAVLTADDVRVINLAGQTPAPGAAGRAFWSASQKRLVFTASNLPTLSPGRQYQLWVIPPGEKTPISAGMLDLQAGGRVLTLADSPRAVQVGAVAVSEEPVGGVAAPTGPIVLLGSL